MAKYVETRFPRPHSFEGQETLFPKLRKLWLKIKKSKLFEAFRHSRLNPYHFGIMHIQANSLEDVRKIAWQKQKARC